MSQVQSELKNVRMINGKLKEQNDKLKEEKKAAQATTERVLAQMTGSMGM